MRQKTTEAFRLARLTGELSCNSYLEIGCASGGLFLAIGCGMKKAVAVDMPESRWGSRGTRPLLERRVRDLRHRLGVDSHLIIGRSGHKDVIRRAEELGPYDLIMIDADHTYDAVKADYENYKHMARKAIAFHDIIGEGAKLSDGTPVEVPRLWGELKPDHTTIEFAETWGDKPMGIGVILL